MIPGDSCFLTLAEKQQICQRAADPLLASFVSALRNRVSGRTCRKELLGADDDIGWWYPVFEYLSDAAMYHALYPDEQTAGWLRNVTLWIIRRPASEWGGPWFRDHSSPQTGHLETAHVCWGVAAVLDLASGIFTSEELEEIKGALIEKGIGACERWVKKNKHLANWRGILLAGILVPAAVLRKQELLDQYLPEAHRCWLAFQADGSYAESLQYGNYLANALMLVYESMVRVYPDYAVAVSTDVYAKGMPWVINGMMYQKPLSGWGAEPRARAVNFNDSAVLFRPSGDLLLHIACRATAAQPLEAGLARWLFDKYYSTAPGQGPHHLASFGFVNDWGFLTLPLLGQAAGAITPQQAGLSLTKAFDNGNTFVRDAWDGKSILAIQGGAAPLNGPGHLHGDVHSFILAYNQERLLIDPGHSCYRNLIHGLESATQTHNTCSFLAGKDTFGLQEDLSKARLLEQQSVLAKRLIIPDGLDEPVVRGNRSLIVDRIADISVIGSEASALYGQPVQEFSRFWIAAGSHVLFVIDRIRATAPVLICWNWLANNRDKQADVKVNGQEIRIERPRAGLRIWQGGDTRIFGPIYSYAHDAYHPEPDHLGEGRPGSGLLFRATSKNPTSELLTVHITVADDADSVDGWSMVQDGKSWYIDQPDEGWVLEIQAEEPLHLILRRRGQTVGWELTESAETFHFKAINIL